jgi:hypothetical protein
MDSDSESCDNNNYGSVTSLPTIVPQQWPTDIERETWKEVPGSHSELWASSAGRILQYTQRGKKWYKPTFGTTIRQGYLTLVHRQKVRRVHILIASAFHGPKPSPEHTVDHIAKYNGDWQKERSDNRAVNLRWASRIEQAQNKNQPTRRVDLYQQGPALWRPDEEFRESFIGIKVSQYGRALNKHCCCPYTPTGTKGDPYASIGGSNGKRNRFHLIIALTFPDICGDRPNNETATVDHIDRDPSNNIASNLRWATKSEQSFNQTRQDSSQILDTLKVAVECKAPGDATWVAYQSLSEAADKLGIHHNTIRQAINKNPDGYVIKIREHSGWCFRVKKDRTHNEMSIPLLKMLVDCKAPGSDQWVPYQSYKAASRATGIHCNTIRTAASKNQSGHTITMKCKARGWSFRMH